MARKSAVQRQLKENATRAKQAKDRAAHTRRKARKTVDTNVHTTQHDLKCSALTGRICDC